MDRDNFHLDKYLNLSIRKFYNINFKPLLRVLSSHEKEAPATPITYGRFTLRLDLYRPKKAQVDYQNPDMDNFVYVTSAEKDVVVEEGVINENMGMPFYIDETVVLSYKNLVAITLTPKDEPFLQPSTRFFPFYAKEVNKKSKTYPLENYRLKPDALENLAHIRQTGFKLPPGLFDTELLSPLKLFKTYFFGSLSHNNSSFMTLEQLEQALTANDPNRVLPPLEQERILHEPGQLARQTLKRLCPLFYPDASQPEFEDCINNPEEHIKRQPNNHIMDIVSTKDIRTRDGKTITIPVGTYKEGINGSLQVGNRFSNSSGIRSHNGIGYRLTRSIQHQLDWGIKSPGFVGGSYGTSYAEQDMDFDSSAHSHMATSFNFGYAEIKQNTLSFNSLSLEFNAKIIHCFTASSLKNPNASFYVCDDQPRYARMEEQWYFIADLNKKNTQFIADPGKIGDSRGPRIIRGRYNFNHFWMRVIEKSSSSIHRTALYPHKMDFVRQHILQIQKTESGLFDKVNRDGYDFFPGLIIPTSD